MTWSPEEREQFFHLYSTIFCFATNNRFSLRISERLLPHLASRENRIFFYNVSVSSNIDCSCRFSISITSFPHSSFATQDVLRVCRVFREMSPQAVNAERVANSLWMMNETLDKDGEKKKKQFG
jgi:hypothetical protein